MRTANQRLESNVPVTSLKLHPDNARKGDVDAIGESIDENGFFGTIVVQVSTGHILAGNHTYLAAVAKGATGVDVAWVDVDDETADRILAAANSISDRSGYDSKKLAALLQKVSATPRGLKGSGYQHQDLKDLLQKLKGRMHTPDEDVVPAGIADPSSVRGQVYLLGPHRVICGDSTDAATLATLMDGAQADMVWTDPPYGVAYEGSALTEQRAKIANDELTGEALQVFLGKALGNAVRACRPGAAWYVASPSGVNMLDFAKVLSALGVWRHTLIWNKDSFVPGRADYHYQHETIFYGWEPNGPHFWCGRRDLSTLQPFKRPRVSEEHPTMKPVELVQAHIENSSRAGWKVLDVFGGSGTTLLAAASTGRVAYLVEWEPRYVDVIRRRWAAWATAAGIDPGPGALLSPPAGNAQ